LKAGPLRQGVAVLGLLALAPTMMNVALGKLSPGEAAVRALITFGVVILTGHVLAMAMRFYVKTVERAQDQEVELRRMGDRAV